MRKQLIFCAALAAVAAFTAPAQAQYGPAYPHIYRPGLPPYQVVRIVRAAGLTPMSPVIRRGPNYVVVAVDRVGTQMRVVVNGYSGMIMRVRPVVAVHTIRQPYGPLVAEAPYAPRPPAAVAPGAIEAPPAPAYGADPYGLTPPRAVPNVQAIAKPQRTPLPRPRPTIASNEPAPAKASPTAVSPEAVPAQTSAAAPAQPDKPILAETTKLPETAKAAETAKSETEAWPKPATSAENPSTSGELKLVPVAPLN